VPRCSTARAGGVRGRSGPRLLSPYQQVGRALAGRLRASPELKVVDSVPRAVAIAVMHGLASAQWPAKVLLHHIAVFQNLPAVDRDNPVAVTGAAPCPARCSQRVGATENASPSAPLIVHAAEAVTLREARAFGASHGTPLRLRVTGHVLPSATGNGTGTVRHLGADPLVTEHGSIPTCTVLGVGLMVPGETRTPPQPAADRHQGSRVVSPGRASAGHPLGRFPRRMIVH
jgi:hypothetical protein